MSNIKNPITNFSKTFYKNRKSIKQKYKTIYKQTSNYHERIDTNSTIVEKRVKLLI